MIQKTRNISSKLFKEFLESEKAGGLILIACTLISLALANSFFSSEYIHFWHTPFHGQPIEYWINDGLMTIFFLLIGLELEREVYQGELSDIKNALLPIFGAIGGMLVPQLSIYILIMALRLKLEQESQWQPILLLPWESYPY